LKTVIANGVTLAYEIRGKGEPLLLIAGVGYGGWFWHRLAPLLADRYRVISFDNRGAGGSSKPAGVYRVKMLAADSVGLLDALDVGRAHVLGHSLGGFVAQELALAQPARIHKLILAGTHHGGPGAIPVTPQAAAVLMNRFGDPATLIKNGIEIATAPGFRRRQPALAREILRYRLTQPVPQAQFLSQVMAGMDMLTLSRTRVARRMRALAMPSLLLFGEHDRVVPPGNAELMAAKLPDARVKLLRGCGHLFPLEDPQATADAISRFLN
jgi:pimeloyl-ACP methyl ester carboxylesterase